MTGTTPSVPRQKSQRRGATRLAIGRLRAIEEALIFRLAGEIEDDETIPTADYDAALHWASEQITRRNRRIEPDRSGQRACTFLVPARCFCCAHDITIDAPMHDT